MAFAIKAKDRNIVGGKVRQLREKGWLPAVVYGRGFEAKNLQVEYNPFAKLLKQAGYSGLIDLEMEKGERLKVLIQEVARDPISDRLIHVDLHRVSLTEKVESKIVLRFVGESPAVKELKAVLIKNISSVHVTGLPQDLVPEIEVNLSFLKKFGDRILIKDIQWPKGITAKAKMDEIVATVTQFVEEKVEMPVAEADAVAGVGVLEKKKEAEGEEGAAAGAGAGAGEKKAEGKKAEVKKPEGKKEAKGGKDKK